ncbi:MAG: helix-turn-helix domain-containing protein [Kiritimatiellaeota bacterium]|nr:helix-turn-helix domain-containing protein [Kiritimatiellota bacterium]
MNDATKRNGETVEGLLASLYKAPVKTRSAAMLAARRALEGKPTALLCSQAEAGRLLQVSRFTIWRMAREGQLHPVTVRGARRYSIAALEAIAAGNTAA